MNKKQGLNVVIQSKIDLELHIVSCFALFLATIMSSSFKAIERMLKYETCTYMGQNDKK